MQIIGVDDTLTYSMLTFVFKIILAFDFLVQLKTALKTNS